MRRAPFDRLLSFASVSRYGVVLCITIACGGRFDAGAPDTGDADVSSGSGGTAPASRPIRGGAAGKGGAPASAGNTQGTAGRLPGVAGNVTPPDVDGHSEPDVNGGASGDSTAEPGGAAGAASAPDPVDCLSCNQAYSQSSLKVCEALRASWFALQRCVCTAAPQGCSSECSKHALCSKVEGGGFTVACGQCLETHCLSESNDCYAN